MTLEAYQKKQILFPGIVTRIITVLLDLMFLSFFVSPIIKFIALYIFKASFADFIALNEIELKTSEDIMMVINYPGFFEKYENSVQYFICFLEIMFIQFVLMAGYFVFCWHKFGTTVAKYIFKIKVMDFETQAKPSLLKCVIRYFSYILFPVSVVVSLFRKDKKAIHDLLAGTIVVKY